MSRSYEKAPTRYAFPGTDLGGSNATLHIKGPLGKAGRLYDYGVEGLTEACAGSSTTPTIAIGTVADPDHYGNEFDVGALAIASGTKSIRTTYLPTDTEFEGTYMLIRDLPADTVVMVSITAATGTPTGTGVVFVDIVWDD